MLRKWLSQADVKITLEPVDPVLIKSGYATIDGEDMVPVSTFKDGKRVYYFPGELSKRRAAQSPGAYRPHFASRSRVCPLL